MEPLIEKDTLHLPIEANDAGIEVTESLGDASKGNGETVHLSNKQKRKLRQLQEQQQKDTSTLVECDKKIIETDSQPNKKLKIKHNTNFQISNVDPNKKLLIFDLNHVLLHRKPCTSSFVLRPYVQSFLRKMSDHFTLAVWSSMQKSKHSRELVQRVFQQTPSSSSSAKPSHTEASSTEASSTVTPITSTKPHSGIPLLFAWFQNHCEMVIRDGKDADVNDDSSSTGKTLASASATVTTNQESTIVSSAAKVKPLKPIFRKNLENVWKEYPAYNHRNTILVDDSKEKGVNNAPYNLLHPRPFHLSAEDEAKYFAPTSSWNSKNSTGDKHIDGNITNDSDVTIDQNLISDAELAPDGELTSYLLTLARFDGDVESFHARFGSYKQWRRRNVPEEPRQAVEEEKPVEDTLRASETRSLTNVPYDSVD